MLTGTTVEFQYGLGATAPGLQAANSAFAEQRNSSPRGGSSESRKLLGVRETADFLGVSQTWVHRHKHELPLITAGRLLRFDSALLMRQFSGKIQTGKSLNRASNERMRMIQRNQRGYVYKRGAGRVWYGRFREDVLTPEGKIVRRTRNVRLGTSKELPSRTAAVIRLQDQMVLQKPRTIITFAELNRRWQVAEVPTMKPTTANYYQKILRAHVLPVFGNREIARISREDIQIFLAEQARKYRKNTLRGMRVSLGKLLTWAVDNNWLEKNPCSNIKLPEAGKEQKSHRPLKAEQVIAIAEQLNEPYSTLVLFLAVTGLRIGEAIGIKWSDFDGDVLTVSRTIYQGKAQSPKTKKSIKSLPIPASLLERMRKVGGMDFVFRSRTGTPVNPGNALKRYVRPVAEELGIELDGWHAFRRTIATTLLRRGESAKLVSDILGNSVEILLKSYDLPQIENFRAPLAQVAGTLLPTVTNPTSAS